MDNNTEPDNKDIPDNSSDQHISPDETGDFTTPEELAEWAANIDEYEPVGFLTGGNTFVTAQPEPQTQEQFDRKPLEVKLFNMGFTTEEIAQMSDDELKGAVEANTGFEPEFVFGGETGNEKSDNVVDTKDNDFHLEDCVIEGPPVYSFGGSPNNAAPSKEDSNATSNDKENQEEQNTPPEITEIPEDKDISAVFTSLPSGIIECQLPDIGAIPLEMQTERTSVIVLPNKASAQAAKKDYPKCGLFDSVTDSRLNAQEAKIPQGAKMLAVPETAEALCNLLNRSKIEFFLIILDFDILQGEASYREAVSTMYDAYTRHPEDRRCIITSDAGAFSDPNMKNEKRYILKGGNAIKRKPEIISCRNITLALKKAIEGIRRPKEIAVLYNSVQQSRLAILNLKKNYQNECGIICSEASKDEAGEFYIDKELDPQERRVTFYTGQNAIPPADKPLALIIVSDASRGSTTLSVKQIIKMQDAIGDNERLTKNIIIHNTFYCHPKDWEASFSSFIERGNRVAVLLNATEALAKDDKSLGRFFRPIRRIVQYKVGIRGRFQQVNLLRQDSAKEWKPAYMAIDSLLVRTRMLENLYSNPHRLSDALKAYYPDLRYRSPEDEPEEVPEEQRDIEKSERRKSLDRAADSRNRELNRISEMKMMGQLDENAINKEISRGRSSKRKVWREFQRIYPYLPTEEAVKYLKEIKSGNRIGFKNLNNSIMFWALDDEHPLKLAVCSAFKAGERYTSKEIKEKMSPIVKYHFNRDIMAEEAGQQQGTEAGAQTTDNTFDIQGLTVNGPKPKKNSGRQAQGRKLITLFKSFLNAERPRDVYVTASESPYQTHCRRIAKDDNDLMQYFML